MTTEPNAIVEPIHEKAMPVMLMTPEDVEQWLRGSSVEDALEMQKPASDDAIVISAYSRRKRPTASRNARYSNQRDEDGPSQLTMDEAKALAAGPTLAQLLRAAGSYAVPI